MYPEISGINGEIGEVKYMEAAGSGKNEDIDIKKMAEWAMNYLARSPKPEYGYQPVFQVFPLRFPSVREGDDPIVNCDTDARMDWEWFYMRDIAQNDFAKDIEEKFHERMRSYINEEGLAMSHGGCYREDLPDAVYGDEDKIIHVWGTLKILRSLCEDYRRTKNPERQKLAGKIVSALKKLFIWGKTGGGESFCYAPNGMGPVDPNDKESKNYWNTHHAPAVGPILDYYLITGDIEALEFAKAAALGIMESRLPGSVIFAGDGSFRDPAGNIGHSHATMHCVWGIAELGLATGGKKYIEFAKRSFDWMMSRSTGTGWFPALPDSCNETCAISDMISVAVLLGRAGYSEYFDYAERFFRNYIVNLQFVMTPEMESHYKKIHSGQSEEELGRQIELLKKVQGAIIGGSGINDYENELLGGVSGFSIFGCCAPEGMRAISKIYVSSAVRETQKDNVFLPEGEYINMAFNMRNGSCQVRSFFPDCGGAEIIPEKDGKIYVRIPHWADKNAAGLKINGKKSDISYSESHPAYAEIEAKAGDVIDVSWPLASFTHTSQVWHDTAPDLKVEFDWLGNSVISCRPAASPGKIPLFSAKPRILPDFKET